MQQIGFGHIWRDIVCGLLASSTTQVMLNGSPGEQIAHRRGLRQGDPLSPHAIHPCYGCSWPFIL
jgi:hypothetical protein